MAYTEESKLERLEHNEGKFHLQDLFLDRPCIVVGHLPH